MTKLFEQAIETARTASPALQDDAARLLLQFLGEDQPIYQLTPDALASLAEAQAARGELATVEQVRAVSAKYDLGASASRPKGSS